MKPFYSKSDIQIHSYCALKQILPYFMDSFREKTLDQLLLKPHKLAQN